MIIPSANRFGCRARFLARRAFTLPAVLVSSALLVMVLGAVLSAQLFGLKMSTVTEAKLGAISESQKLLNTLITDAHAAEQWKMGIWTQGSFQEIPMNAYLRGNAIIFYPDAANTNSYVRYYRDSTDGSLKRYSSAPVLTTIVAAGVSNTTLFTAQDFKGVTLTNKNSRTILAVNLPMERLDNPDVAIGPGNYYKSYLLRSKISLQSQ